MEKRKLLEITSFRLEELHVESNPAARDDADIQALDPHVEFNAFLHQTDARLFAVSLTVSSQPKDVGSLRFMARITGYFLVAEPFHNGKLNSERVVNGLTILYGLLRGHISTVSSWFDESLMIPTVYFTDLVNTKIAAVRAEELLEEAKPLPAVTKY